MPSSAPHPASIRVFVRSQYLLRDEQAVDDFCCRYHPVVHTDAEGAIKEARLATGIDDEGPEELFAFLAEALGGVPELGSLSDYAGQIAFLAELELVRFRIETTTRTDKAAHLRHAEGLAQQRAPHALWLPADENWPGQRLRIITKASLVDRFRLLSSAAIPARLLAP
jgi:hypothetical protein